MPLVPGFSQDTPFTHHTHGTDHVQTHAHAAESWRKDPIFPLFPLKMQLDGWGLNVGSAQGLDKQDAKCCLLQGKLEPLYQLVSERISALSSTEQIPAHRTVLARCWDCSRGAPPAPLPCSACPAPPAPASLCCCLCCSRHRGRQQLINSSVLWSPPGTRDKELQPAG